MFWLQGDHISMNQQVDNFAITVQQLRRLFRRDVNALGAYLSKCIFYCGLGSNDYLNNYFMTDYYSTSSQYTPKAYADSLIQDYSRQLTVNKHFFHHSDPCCGLCYSVDHVRVCVQALYNLGARKVVVTGVGQIGCIPYQLARYNGSGSRCNEEINNVIVLFNTGLRQLVDRFNKGQLPGAKFVYLDSFFSSQDLVQNARTYGIRLLYETIFFTLGNYKQI